MNETNLKNKNGLFFLLIFLSLLSCSKEDVENPDLVENQEDIYSYELVTKLTYPDTSVNGSTLSETISKKFTLAEGETLSKVLDSKIRKINEDIIFPPIEHNFKVWECSNPPAVAQIEIDLFQFVNEKPSPISVQKFNIETPDNFSLSVNGETEKLTGQRELLSVNDPTQDNRTSWDVEIFTFFPCDDTQSMQQLIANLDRPDGLSHYWVFAGGLNQVEVTINVINYVTKIYSNATSLFKPIVKQDMLIPNSGGKEVIEGSHLIGSSPCPTKLGHFDIKSLENDHDQYSFRLENGHSGLDIIFNDLNGNEKTLRGEFNSNDALGSFNNKDQKIYIDFNCQYAASIDHTFKLYIIRKNISSAFEIIKEMDLNVIVTVP